MATTTLDLVKISLRVTSAAFDSEIQDSIDACKLDLSISGVVVIEETDALILQAIKTYCKANFGLDEKDTEKYQASYNLLKQHLSLCGDYNTGVI